MDGACIGWPDGSPSVLAYCEYPNGLALSLDERTMYGEHALVKIYPRDRFDAAGNMVGRSSADMNEGSPASPAA